MLCVLRLAALAHELENLNKVGYHKEKNHYLILLFTAKSSQKAQSTLPIFKKILFCLQLLAQQV